jgi:hypothetical protein
VVLAQTPLTSAAAIKVVWGIPPQDNSYNPLIEKYITQCTAFINNYCHRKDFGLQVYTEIQSGSNTQALVLRNLPISTAVLAITNVALTSNIATLTFGNVPTGSTMGMFVGFPVVVAGLTNAVFNGTYTIATVTGNTITYALTHTNISSAPDSGTCTSGGIFSLYYNTGAFSGDAPNAFTSSSLMVEGNDYYVDWEAGPGTACTSGLVYRLGSFWSRPYSFYQNLLSMYPGSPSGNVKVTYLAGYQQIPFEVQAASELLIARMKQTRFYGQHAASLSNEGMSVSIPESEFYGQINKEVGSLLSRYRVLAMGF